MPSGWGYNFLNAKMGGVSVVHDEFRGMGLSGVRGVMGEGAVEGEKVLL